MENQNYAYTYPDKMTVSPGSTYIYALSHTRPGMRVLDVGSGPGHFSLLLKQNLCDVVCIEANEQAARRAEKSGLRVLRLDLGVPGWSMSARGSYDLLVMLDVLEHLPHPSSVLMEAHSLLATDGRLVVSVPNVAHAAVRLPLLTGSWNYEWQGLLDESHIRFFARESFVNLLRSAGYHVLQLDRVYRLASQELIATTARRLGTSVSSIHRLLAETEGVVWQYVALCEASEAAFIAGSAPPTTTDLSHKAMQVLRVAEGLVQIVTPLIVFRRRLRRVFRPLRAWRRRAASGH